MTFESPADSCENPAIGAWQDEFVWRVAPVEGVLSAVSFAGQYASSLQKGEQIQLPWSILALRQLPSRQAHVGLGDAANGIFGSRFAQKFLTADAMRTASPAFISIKIS